MQRLDMHKIRNKICIQIQYCFHFPSGFLALRVTTATGSGRNTAALISLISNQAIASLMEILVVLKTRVRISWNFYVISFNFIVWVEGMLPGAIFFLSSFTSIKKGMNFDVL